MATLLHQNKNLDQKPIFIINIYLCISIIYICVVIYLVPIYQIIL